MPLTFRSGESIGAAKARQASSNTFASIRQAMTSNAAYSVPKADPKPKKKSQFQANQKSTAVASPAPAAKITKVAPTPAPKTTVAKVAPVVDQGLNNREAAYVKPAAPKPKAPAAEPAKNIGTQIAAAVEKVATGGVLGTIGKIITQDKYRHGDTPAYNQEYWAKRREEVGGAQAGKEVMALGTKKAYSGDIVVTKDQQRKAQDDLKRITGSMAVLDNLSDLEKKQLQVTTTKAGGIQPFLDVGGVTKTVGPKTGLLDQHQKTTYEYKDGPTVITKATDPVLKTPLGNLRLGQKTSTTYVDGIEVATKTGGDELGVGAKTTFAQQPAHITDTTQINPETLTTVEQVEQAIAATTDEKQLAALHNRLRALSRAGRTQTKFGGLTIGEADVAATQLGGLRIK